MAIELQLLGLLPLNSASEGVPELTYDQTLLALSPTGYWRLNEASGTTAADASGGGNDGTYEGTISYQDSGLSVASIPRIKLTDAIDNAQNDIEVAANTLWNLDGGGSLVLWMRRASDEFFNFLASQWDASEGGNLDGWILSCHNVGGGGPAPASFIARNGGTVDILVGSTTVN